MPKEVFIATNNGDIGGGEVMLLNIARSLRLVGYSVTVVGPVQPAELLDAAQDEGFDAVILPANNRKQYILQLRIWDKTQRQGLLWCNGLVPSFATAGHKNRIVHLHQLPQNKSQKLIVKPAQKNALVTLVPSQFAANAGIKNVQSFPNWVQEVPGPLLRQPENPLRIGFIGRPSAIKGTHILTEAISALNAAENKTRFKLVIAGETKYISEEDQDTVDRALEAVGDNLILMGRTTQEEFFKNIDLLVVPSIWDEVFGLVAAEAMSARVPLLVSDAGALPEVVGKNYPWIFPKDNVNALAEMIQKVTGLLTNKPEECASVVSANYWRWLEHYSPEAGKQRVAELLEQISHSSITPPDTIPKQR